MAKQEFQWTDLISPGISLLGTGISAIGAGIEGDKQLDFEKQKHADEMAVNARKRAVEQEATDRTLGMKGIGMISQLRDAAQKNYRRNALHSALVSGGV